MENREFYEIGKGIRKLQIPEGSYLTQGGYGKIFALTDGRLAKVYYVPFPVKAKKDTKKVLKKVKDLNIEGIYKIFNLLYDKKTLEFKGYTMERVKGDSLENMTVPMARRILDMSSESSIDNLVKLENINYRLSNNGIYLSDDFGSNIIVHDGTFTVVDVDSYLLRPNARERVITENNETVNSLVAALPIKAAMVLQMSREDVDRIRQRSKELFFNPEVTLSDKISELEKEKTLGSLLLKR